MARAVYQTGYSPVGDLIVVAIGYVMIILMVFSYINKTRAFRIFLSTVAMVMLAAMTDVGFNMLTKAGRPEHLTLIFILRCAFHFFLFGIFQMFVIYIAEVTRLDRRRSLIFALLGALDDILNGLRRLCTIAQPVLRAFEVDFLGVVTGIVEAQVLNEATIAGRTRIRDHDTPACGIARAGTTKTNLDSHRNS